jgi:polyhydroxyalkanoate synthase
LRNGRRDAWRESLDWLDRARREQGRWLDRLGLGPIEAPWRSVLERPGFCLRGYAEPMAKGPALVIVPAPIKRAYIWDLAPGSSVVRATLAAGMAVYLVEWLEPEDEDLADWGLADYADGFLGEVLDAVEVETGADSALLAGHSLGGTLAAIFAARRPERVAGLVLIEAPLHFAEESGAFAPIIAAAPHAAGEIRKRLGFVPGAFLDQVSVRAAPESFVAERWLDAMASAADPGTLSTHIRAVRWMLDEFSLPGRLFEEVVAGLYRDDLFHKGELTLAGVRIGPGDIAAALVTVFNPHSRVVPPESVLPFVAACTRSERRTETYDGDVGVALQHVGALIGRRAHRELWPKLIQWMERVWTG